MAGSMGDTYEKKVLDLIFRNTNASATVPLGLDATNVWVGLGTAAADGSFTELAATGSYARVAVIRTGAGWNAAINVSPALTVNTGAIAFPTASANWNAGSPVTHFGIFDVVTVGSAATTLVYWADLTVSKVISSGDTATFAAGAINVTQD
jgi:hypothetical protein